MEISDTDGHTKNRSTSECLVPYTNKSAPLKTDSTNCGMRLHWNVPPSVQAECAGAFGKFGIDNVSE